jgi:hypothetical protein
LKPSRWSLAHDFKLPNIILEDGAALVA